MLLEKKLNKTLRFSLCASSQWRILGDLVFRWFIYIELMEWSWTICILNKTWFYCRIICLCHNSSHCFIILKFNTNVCNKWQQIELLKNLRLNARTVLLSGAAVPCRSAYSAGLSHNRLLVKSPHWSFYSLNISPVGRWQLISLSRFNEASLR